MDLDTLYVGKMLEAQKLYTELGFPVLKKGGHDKNLVGYLFADTETINQLVHIWKFKNDGHRRAHWRPCSRTRISSRGFDSKFRPLVMSQEVKLMTEAPWGAASVRGRCQASSPKQTSCSRRV